MTQSVSTKSQNNLSLSMPVQFLKGVGPARAETFAQLGVETVGDLLEYFPRDWVFAPDAIKINQMREGQSATVIGLVESADYASYSRTAIFEAMIADDTGMCRVIWFHGGFLRNQLKVGQVIMVSGRVSLYKHQLQVTNPKFMIVDEKSTDPAEYFGGGVYPASAKLSSRQIKRIIRPVLDGLDELVSAAVPMTCSEKIDSRIRKRFPFLLTQDQDTVIAEIAADMSSSEPMNRLLQGDVGSGKTVVALYAALLAVTNKAQAVIMAPTEILAGQHFISIERYLRNSKVKRVLITGGLTGKKRSQLLKQIATGQINIVVGTVALLQEDIEFKKLGLVVIDEQHKFGVRQRDPRAFLRKQERGRKDAAVHCLVMTATPIPRTLAMTAFGDLDVSVIKHCPPGRGSVITRWVDPGNRQKAFEFIRNIIGPQTCGNSTAGVRERLKAKRQAYFVYPRITSTEQDSDIKAATDEWGYLSREVFPEFTVGLLHGRMPSTKKQQIMSEFRRGKINVLVSTVVIEVGVDVPNATIMVIEGADRFGLAQLHQLRGRVGRGEAKSYCFLFAETDSETAKNRLEVMTRSNDGFEIAECDLRLRGPGELFSTRQHGLPDLKIANIIDDYELLVMARRHAFEMVSADPMLTEAEHKNIRQALIAKFGVSLGLADVA